MRGIIDLALRAEELFQQFLPIIEGTGNRLVSVSFAKSSGTIQLVLVIYNNKGISHKELAKIHNTVRARLEIIDPSADRYSIEVSTPGIERTLKNPWEYDVFSEKGVKILYDNETDWFGGIMKKHATNSIVVQNKEKSVIFEIDRIRKAKLDPTYDRG